MQTCTMCMYACVHIGVHCWQDGVSLRGSNTDGNPSYGSVGWKPLVRVCHVLYYFPIETRETSQQVSHLSGCTRVCIYACTCAGVLYACVWWDWMSYMVRKGLKMWEKKRRKKGYRIDIAKWMCASRDWVWERTLEYNLLMTSSVRLVNDTN